MRALSERQLRWLFGGIGFLCFAGLLAFETLTDEDGFRLLDFLSEALTLLLLIGSTTGFGLLVHRLRLQHEEHRALVRDREIARKEGRAWRAKAETHLSQLRSELEHQFEQWGLTAAERDVGLLMLKGLSHKEIAALRETGDVTVRQQAQAIYRKSNLPGKTAFCAYFLEDLFETSAPTASAASPADAPARSPAAGAAQRAPERTPGGS